MKVNIEAQMFRREAKRQRNLPKADERKTTQKSQGTAKKFLNTFSVIASAFSNRYGIKHFVRLVLCNISKYFRALGNRMIFSAKEPKSCAKTKPINLHQEKMSTLCNMIQLVGILYILKSPLSKLSEINVISTLDQC